MKPTLESRDQWDADIVSIALRTGGTIPADLFVREMKRAIATEREACAKVCEIVWDSRAGLETGTAIECAAVIRAMGEK